LIIVLKSDASKAERDHVLEKVKSLGFKPVISEGVERTIIGVIGNEAKLRVQPLEAFPGVDHVMEVQTPFKMVSREFTQKDTVVTVGSDLKIGGNEIIVMAGPCTIEAEDRLLRIAELVKAAGAKVLRGGAFKPRTSPYDFQGLGEKGLHYMETARKQTGLMVVSEIMDAQDLPIFEKYVDIIQVGARNMQNFNLLKALGAAKKPVLLKRGMANTIKDFLMAAEYIFAHGNHNVILCERGIRTFENATRFTLDISAVPVIKSISHLPIIIDPSHPAGKREIVPALTRAAIAAGADGIIVEVHDNPEEAMCDGPQALLPDAFSALMKDLRNIAKVVGRQI
jgi:3-deoxy-7-phosphoheptulonate synthase